MPTGELEGRAGEFQTLSRALLTAAARGTDRPSFVRDALDAIAAHARASGVALRISADGGAIVYTRGSRPETFRARREALPGGGGAGGWRRNLSPEEGALTPLGSFWATATQARRWEELRPGDLPPHLRAFPPSSPSASAAWIPLVASADRFSALRLEREGGAFEAEELRLYEAVAQILAATVEGQRARWALGERIKELGCLYALARITGSPETPLAEALSRVASALPPAWQHTQRASARVVVDDVTAVSVGFREGTHRLAVPVTVDGVRAGSVEVHYDDDAPADEEGRIFLREEERLLEVVAGEVQRLVERDRRRRDRSRLEAQLRHADRLATIGQLAAGVAHELNEPLGAILGFAQLASRGGGLPATAAADLEKIVTAALHARGIVRDLGLFARREPPRSSPVRLESVIDEAVALVEPRCQGEGIRVSRSAPEGLPSVLGDAAQLRQVFVNLLVNAVQAMPEGGTIAVTVRADGSDVAVTVADEGVGIPASDLPKVFEPFYTTKDVGKGTGLGLSVAHGIVSAHGGSVSVESEEGGGARFVVRIPAIAAESAS